MTYRSRTPGDIDQMDFEVTANDPRRTTKDAEDLPNQQQAHPWETDCPIGAIEYSDDGNLVFVDPHSGQAFVAPVLADGVSQYDGLRRLIDLMERERFLDEPDAEPRIVRH